VYLEAPDVGKHPELPKATPYKVRLRPGSVLYLPSYWHHEVTSQPDAKEGLNIAVNYWFRNTTFFAEEAQGLLAAARHKKERQRQRRGA
jgi:ribosomal protein L16 Arg81 hydroxylase